VPIAAESLSPFGVRGAFIEWFDAFDAARFALDRSGRDVPAVGQASFGAAGLRPGSPEEEELDCVWAAIEAYEAKRRAKAA
jgi:hypothetical protein